MFMSLRMFIDLRLSQFQMQLTETIGRSEEGQEVVLPPPLTPPSHPPALL